MADAENTSFKRRIWTVILYGLFLCVVLIASILGGWINSSHVMRELVLTTMAPKDPIEVFGRDRMNVLILGCDKNVIWTKTAKIVSDENTRSDMMLVAQIDFKNNTITGLSIPRDLYLELPGYGGQKINGYHADGGPELAREAAEEVLGVRIDRVVKLDYDAFQEMVDMVGGVEVYVARDMKYTDRAADLFIDLHKGRQTLDGYDAMCYVRYRKGDSDFVRQDRQKEFAMAMKDRVARDPSKIPALADKMLDLTSNAFTVEELVQLMRFTQKVGGDNVRLGMVPVVDWPNDPQYRLLLDRDKLDDTLEEFGFRDESRRTAQTESAVTIDSEA